jgi:PAS domain S-box-containing protein
MSEGGWRSGQTRHEALALLDGVRDYAIFMLDAEGRVQSWNAGAEAIKQYRAAEIIGEHFSRFYSAEDVAAGRPARLLNAAATEGRVEDEGWRVRKDGTRFWAVVVITAIKDERGQLLGFTKVTRDLTARKAAEDAVRRSEESLAATLYSIGDAVITTDEHGLVTRLNPVAERLTGWSQSEAVGKPVDSIFVIVNEHTRRPALNPVHRVLKEGIVVGLANHTVLIARDGSERPIADTCAPIRDTSGRDLGTVLVFRDVSAERRAEEALRQSEERLRLMIASVQDYAIFMLDAGGRITSWNAGAERMTGYRAEEIVGSHFSRLVPPEDVQAGKPARELQTAVADGRYEEEGWRVRKDGKRFWANVVISRVRNDAGELIGFTKVTRDMTERRRAEQAERDASVERLRSAAAEAAVRQRDVFLSVAAHELRTPLTALLLKLEGLERLLRQEAFAEPRPGKAESRLRDALRQTHRLGELVERLLDVSRLAAGQLELRPARLELEAVARAVVADFQEKAKEAHSEVRMAASGDSSGCWDRGRLEQVLSNLLANAVKYGKGQPIDVIVEGRRDGDVRFAVTDRGIGIARSDLDRIFEAFERAAPVEHFSGLGLGLYICRRIVDAHGGRIDVTSQPGEGTTVAVTLPRAWLHASDEALTEEARS